MKTRSQSPLPEKEISETRLRRRSFLSFAAFAGLNVAAFGAWKWLRNSPKEQPGITAGVQQPLRKVLDKTEGLSRSVFSDDHLAKTYPKSMAAKKVRPNGYVGLNKAEITDSWRMSVRKNSGQILEISLAELKAIPKTEIIYDFKCVEGWDQIQHWGGVTFQNFIEHFNLSAETTLEYVGMETPDERYYVGLDMPSALHPQTILAYEMNGRPLVNIHGAPLRLIMPVKYGIKNLKCIGKIFFSNSRPRDYWAERGYDYYSGL